MAFVPSIRQCLERARVLADHSATVIADLADFAESIEIECHTEVLTNAQRHLRDLDQVVQDMAANMRHGNDVRPPAPPPKPREPAISIAPPKPPAPAPKPAPKPAPSPQRISVDPTLAPGLVTTPDALRLLGFSQARLYQLQADASQNAPVAVGRHGRQATYRIADIEAFNARRAAAKTTGAARP